MQAKKGTCPDMQMAASAHAVSVTAQQTKVVLIVTLPVPNAPHIKVQGAPCMKLEEFLWKDPGLDNSSARAQVPYTALT